MLGDGIGEGVSIACRPARIDEEQDISVGRKILERGLEPHVVHAMRAAVNLQQQRITARRIEARRLDYPALNVGSRARVEPDFVGFGQIDAAQRFIVEVRNPLWGFRAARIDQHHVLGRAEIGSDRGDCAAPRRGGEHDLRAARDLANAAVERPGIEMDASLILGREVQRTAVRRPDQAFRLAVETRRSQRGIAAVRRHGPQIRDAARIVILGEPDISDGLAVRRQRGPRPTARGRRQTLGRAGGEIHGIDVALPVVAVRIALFIAFDDCEAPILREFPDGGIDVDVFKVALADIPISAGDLAGCAAVHRDQKQMAPSLLGIPERVATVVHPLGVQRRARPF